MKTNLLFGIAAAVFAMNADAGALVTARNSPIAPLDKEEAKRIFLGYDKIVNGQTVTLVFQKDEKVRNAFEESVIGFSGTSLSSYLYQGIFTGRIKPPIEADNDAAVKAKVTSVPGAIGYISDSAVDDSVKVLLKY
jgi:hypothetical protein